MQNLFVKLFKKNENEKTIIAKIMNAKFLKCSIVNQGIAIEVKHALSKSYIRTERIHNLVNLLIDIAFDIV